MKTTPPAYRLPAWSLALAALAVTGCRPASLEKGIFFSIVEDKGENYIEATVSGVKVSDIRGQPEYKFRWSSATETHRPDELVMLCEAIVKTPGNKIVVRYDAEAISARLRELSERLWPRRKNKITGYCYRELLSATGKAAGVPPGELALAMGHISTESQGKYASAARHSRGGVKPWGAVTGAKPVRAHRSPMVRFKIATAIKKSISGGAPTAARPKIRRSI